MNEVDLIPTFVKLTVQLVVENIEWEVLLVPRGRIRGAGAGGREAWLIVNLESFTGGTVSSVCHQHL